MMALPPRDLEVSLMRGVLQTKCKWWCRARWYADRLHIHPAATTAVLTVRRCAEMAVGASPFLKASVRQAAAWLQLGVVWHDGAAPWLVYTGDDYRLLGSLARLAAKQGRPHTVQERRRFRAADDEPTSHLLRQFARIVLLKGIRRTRLDHEGCERIDVEAQSAKPWTEWRRRLSPSRARWVHLWRAAGVARSPTRRHHDDAEAATCPLCGVFASMRHLWAECPMYADARRRIGRKHQIPEAWWARQPRVTSKSGWITTDGGPTTWVRAQRQVAAAELAILIFSDLCAADSAGDEGGGGATPSVGEEEEDRSGESESAAGPRSTLSTSMA
jgi:hypothetical protein